MTVTLSSLVWSGEGGGSSPLVASLKMSVNQPISKVTRPKLHYCLLKMKSTLLLLEVKLLLLFSWTNQQHLTPLIMVRLLSVWVPGLVFVVLNWFKSYLCDRYQCIKIGSVLSDAKRLLYGVPQGSVLGPILFSLYTTPLSKVIQNHPGICFHFYADDTQLYVHLTHNHATQAFDRLKNCVAGSQPVDSLNGLYFGDVGNIRRVISLWPVNRLLMNNGRCRLVVSEYSCLSLPQGCYSTLLNPRNFSSSNCSLVFSWFHVFIVKYLTVAGIALVSYI